MRSVAIATVVVVLMVLRTAAYPEPPIETTIESTIETTTGTTAPVCPTVPCSESSGGLHYDAAGCPYCMWGDPICGWIVQCGPDEDCLPIEEGSMSFGCFPKYGTTTETTVPTYCPYNEASCTGDCSLDYSNMIDGCPACICVDLICGWLVQCGPDEDCLPSEEASMGFACFPKYGTTTETTTGTPTGPPTPRVCPDMSSCNANCNDSFIKDGCPICGSTRCNSEEECVQSDEDPSGYACVVYPGWLRQSTRETTTWATAIPICTFVTCRPDEQCVPTNENRAGYACLPIYDTRTTTPKTRTATTPCPIPPCARGCRPVPGPVEGCYIGCSCPDSTCEETTCAPGQVCVMQSDECPEEETSCFRWPTCVSSTDTTTPFTTTPETRTSSCPPPPPCADLPGCGEFHGAPDGCLRCVCYAYMTTTPFTTTPETTTPSCPGLPPCAQFTSCGEFIGADGCLQCDCDICENTPCADGEKCVVQHDTCEPSEYPCLPKAFCVSTTETTTGTTTGTTTFCPYVTCGPYCGRKRGSDGCTTCYCQPEDACQYDNYCNEYEECVPEVVYCNSYTCFYRPICIPISTTPTTTPSVTPTVWCPTVTCHQGCQIATDYNGCTYCSCPPSCENVSCAEGEKCELFPTPCAPSPYPCYPQPVCVSITETTTPCPPIRCAPYCVSDTGSDGCPTCACPPSCQSYNCSDGYECQLIDVPCKFVGPCFPEPQCVPIQETTTPCPTIECAPGCVPDNGTDGCPTCECPPSCQTVKCSDGYECQLVNVTCFRYPCFPQPQCVPTENPCTGTPNPRRCGRSNNRWSYNSATDTCELFKYYGCTPTRNTFLSPEACKNKCKGGAQSICKDVVCEKNCYTFTGKSKCPKCICPNPCEGHKCHYGDECKLQEAKGEDEDPEPFCAPKP